MNYKTLACIFAIFCSNSLCSGQEMQPPLISLRWTLARTGVALQILATALEIENPEPILHGILPDTTSFVHKGLNTEHHNGFNKFIKPPLISLIYLIQRANTFFKDKLIDFNITDWLHNKSLYFSNPIWRTTIENYQGFGSTLLDRFDITNPYHWGTALAVSGTAAAATCYITYKLCQSAHAFMTKSATTMTAANTSKRKTIRKQ